MTTATTFSKDEYFDILAESDFKLEYRAGEIYTRWGEPIECRDGDLVTASGLSLKLDKKEIRAMSGAQPPHAALAANLVIRLGLCLQQFGCRVHSSDQLISIEACELEVFPDVVVICEEPRYEKSKGGLYALLNPTIVIEVLSKSTEHYDRVEKFECYRTLESLQQYVLVSTKSKKIEVFSKKKPREWTLQIYDEESPAVRIGDCEADLSEIYWRVVLQAQ